MLINFNNLNELVIPNMNGGDGEISARMYMDSAGKIMISRIPVGASIGEHIQKTSNDINFVISGKGKAICNGEEEILLPGVCHYCTKGSFHSIINTGEEDLVLFTVVAEQ